VLNDSQKRLSSHVTEHLANERTYLAWLRTSFSLLTLGFATNKFSQFMIELQLRSSSESSRKLIFGSRSFGLGMVILATILMMFSSWHYQQTRNNIETGEFKSASILIWAVSILSIFFGFTAIVLLLQSSLETS
jgi:putative membrane protein